MLTDRRICLGIIITDSNNVATRAMRTSQQFNSWRQLLSLSVFSVLCIWKVYFLLSKFCSCFHLPHFKSSCMLERPFWLKLYRAVAKKWVCLYQILSSVLKWFFRVWIKSYIGDAALDFIYTDILWLMLLFLTWATFICLPEVK